MDWVVQPLGGFQDLAVLQVDECDVHYSCSCQGGLCVCEVANALKVQAERAR
jgi:hypothetical protein